MLLESYATKDALKILDVGCGDGSLLSGTLSTLKDRSGIPQVTYHGIDPIELNTARSQVNFTLDHPHTDTLFFNLGYESFAPENNEYDFIVASNLYHLDLCEVPSFVKSLQNRLGKGGAIYFIYRAEKDELVDLQRICDPLILGYEKEVRTIKDITSSLSAVGIGYEDMGTIESKVNLKSPDANRNKVLEFILNYEYQKAPDELKLKAEGFIGERNGTLISRQGILRITA